MNGNNQGPGFPGFGAPGGQPGAPAPFTPGPPAPAAGAPPMADASGFVLDFDEDSTWQPFETTDVLEKDGYYCCRIVKEAPRQDGNKSPGVFLTLEVTDQDAAGKTLSKFMTDPRATKSNTWFVWRNLFLSITGDINQARAKFRYTPGMLTNQYCFIKTAAYMDNSNEMRTGVDSFVTKQQWEEATKAGRHRWPAKPKGGTTAQLPTGLPGGGGFPGGGFPGLPGAPAAPTPGAPAAPAPGFPPTAAPQAAPQQPQVQQPQQPQQPQQMQLVNQPGVQAVPNPQPAQTPQPGNVPSVLQGFPQRN